jgi:phage/plasmid-associated DNA primase
MQTIESFNLHQANEILRHRKCLKLQLKQRLDDDYDPFELLERYVKHSKNGIVKVNYFRQKGKGRLYAEKSLSLQNLMREIRGTIAKDFYQDLDMVNCHYVILNYIMKNEFNFDCEHINYYIHNRNKTLDELFEINKNLTKEDIKSTFLSILYNGKNAYNNIKKNKFLNNLKKELEFIYECINKKYANEIAKVEKDTNKDGSFLSLYIQQFEDKILMAIIDYLLEKKLIKKKKKKFVCVFDGLMISKYIKLNIEELEKMILEKTNIPMKLKIKEFETLKIPTDCECENTDSEEDEDDEEEKQSKFDIFNSVFSNGDMADCFESYYNNLKVYNDKIFKFNGIYWEECKISVYYKMMNDLFFTLLDELNKSKYRKDTKYNDIYNKILGNLVKFRTSSTIKATWELLKGRLEENDDIWDKDENLLGFTNGTYDLKTGTFRNGKREDYITRVIPYDFQEVETDIIEEHFEKVLPDNEIRKLFYMTTCTGLRGRTLQNFIIWTGCGSNSKGLTQKLINTTFGDMLYLKGNNSVLTQPTKGDMNVGIANMNNKRIITYEEPREHEKIITSTMKEITGGDVMAFRGLYSSNTKTNMRATHIMLCNKKPKLDAINEAVNRRLVIIPFEAQFKDKEYIEKFYPEGTPNIYVKNESMEDVEFLETLKLPFLNLLLRYYKEYRENRYEFSIPQRSRDLVKEYMIESDDFSNWFNNKYEFTNNDEDYVKLKDVYNEYKCSDLYYNLDKRTRRAKGTKTAIIKDVIDNPTLRPYYRERIKKNELTLRNIIIRYKEKVINDEDDEDEE